MPGLVPGIHVFFSRLKDVDGRTSPAMTRNMEREKCSPNPPKPANL
jgi:hypothetical protein